MTSPAAAGPALSPAWTKRFDTALTSMRQASDGAFARRSKRLAEVLHDEAFAPARSLLTAGLDLEGFLVAASEDHTNLGEPLPFPSDAQEEMGLAILLLDILAADEDKAEAIAFNYYCDFVDNRTNAAWRNLVEQIYTPLRDDLMGYLEKQGWLRDDAAAVAGSVTIAVSHSSGVSIQNAGSHSTQTATTVVGPAHAAQALATFAEMWRALPLAEDERADLDADVETLGAQLRKREPSPVILREAARTLRSLTESIAGNLVTPVAAAAALALWKVLGL